MTRFVPVTVLVVLLASSGVAVAQSGGGSSSGSLPNSAAIVFERRKIFDPTKSGADKYIEPQAQSTQLLQYFNLAHCNCAKANVGKIDVQGTFQYLVHENPASGLHVGVDFIAGTSCDDAAHRVGGASPTCSAVIDSVSDLDMNLNASGGSYRTFNLFQVVNAGSSETDCVQVDNASNSIFALVDTTGGKNYNYSASQPVGALSTDGGTASGVDTKPPPPPSSPTANPDEGGIDLVWKAPTSNATDVAFYQALCATVDNKPARAATSSARYVTTKSVCDVDVPDIEKPTPIELDNGELAVTPGDDFAKLDISFICGEETGTATSMRIKGLNNGEAYQVILLTIDMHGNFNPQYFDHTITPHLVTDFWEDLHKNAGSHAEGGLCLLAETYGDDSTVARLLRGFRDDTLGGSRIGRWLTEAYYATLGRLGAVIHGSLALRVVAAIVLAPAVTLALLWYWLTLPGLLGLLAAAWWLRRRRRAVTRSARGWSWLRVPVMAAGALVVLGTGRAHAGGGYQPYWENGEIDDKSKQDVPPGDPSLIQWHAGLRLSPYVPDIDNQVGGTTPGPYAQMFGGYHILTMLDVDRILWTGFGQVGIGVSLGYWQKTARPFVMGSDPNATDRPREPGNKNAFKLIPTELTATYRLTMLDDMYGIPVVPYVRGGLAYYIWWITAPNGNYARICDDNGENCGNKALGASLGVRGALGLAIRAERIDASAAMSMQNSGIQHAGIYAELSAAKVDGFGSDSKLSVGATTWFAGVDFEF
jgi:hypothetical protein